jgi:TM2 domain-containing membrane protein YozV
MKSKTTTAWLAFTLGIFGAHRFYLRGWGDGLGWFLPIPTALGIYGMERAHLYGLDDAASWVLIPFVGFTFAACALTAIVYGLMSPEKWKAYMGYPADAAVGQTHWGTVIAVALSLLIGAAVLMSSIVFSFQRYFEYQIVQAQELSQDPLP